MGAINIEGKIEAFKITIGSLTSFAMCVFGQNYRLIIFLLAIMIVDTLTGHLRAIKDKSWTSFNARWGVIGKTIELVLIALLYLCEWTFELKGIVDVVIVYFMLCESASIIENVVKGRLNDNIPSEVIDILTKMKSNAITSVKNWVKNTIGGEDK